MSNIVDVGLVNNAGTNYVFTMALIMAATTIVFLIVCVLGNYYSCKIASQVSTELRDSLYKKISTMSVSDVSKIGKSSLIVRCTNDVQAVQNAIVLCIRCILYAPLNIVFGLIAAFMTCPSLVVVPLVISILISIACVLFIVLSYNEIKRAQFELDNLNGFVSSSIMGLSNIKVFNQYIRHKKIFQSINNKIKKRLTKSFSLLSMIYPLQIISINACTMIVAYLSYGFIVNSAMSVGDVMAYCAYCTEVLLSFLYVGITISSLPKAQVALDRIESVINIKTESLESTCASINNNVVTNSATASNSVLPLEEETHNQPASKYILQIENLSYKFKGSENKIFSNLSFNLPNSSMMCIYGQTGSGKSVILKIIDGLFKDYEGKILINSCDINNCSRYEISQLVGYCTQEDLIFSGSIASNICMNKSSYDDDLLTQILQIACLEDLCTDAKKAKDYQVSEKGKNLSGGQKQRICIARNLYSQRSLLLFDDSLSALDSITSNKIINNIREYVKSRKISAIFTSQKDVPKNYFDKIAYIKNGQLDYDEKA